MTTPVRAEPYLRIIAHGYQYLPTELQKALHTFAPSHHLSNPEAIQLIEAVASALESQFPQDGRVLRNLKTSIHLDYIRQQISNVVADPDVLAGTLPK